MKPSITRICLSNRPRWENPEARWLLMAWLDSQPHSHAFATSGPTQANVEAKLEECRAGARRPWESRERLVAPFGCRKSASSAGCNDRLLVIVSLRGCQDARSVQ